MKNIPLLALFCLSGVVTYSITLTTVPNESAFPYARNIINANFTNIEAIIDDFQLGSNATSQEILLDASNRVTTLEGLRVTLQAQYLASSGTVVNINAKTNWWVPLTSAIDNMTTGKFFTTPRFIGDTLLGTASNTVFRSFGTTTNDWYGKAMDL